MPIHSPERIWWKPIGRQERIWFWTSFVFVIVMFVSMPIWHMLADQNTPHQSYRVTPERFAAIVSEFTKRYQVGSENGIPVVRPPEGEVFLLARQYQWTPILELEQGKTYHLHVSSADVNHGFSIQPVNMNFQVVPGYDYVLEITPPEAGEYTILCNEFCGIGHHLMSGKLIVKE